MKKRVLLRFGDLVLKGKNKTSFIKQLKKLVIEKIGHLDVDFDFQHDRFYIILKQDNLDDVIEAISYVSGISSYSVVYKTSLEIEDIANLGVEIVKNEVSLPTTFKVECKRSNKSYPHTSLEFMQLIAPHILKPFKGELKVDVRKPQHTLHIELRSDGAYLYLTQFKGMGGFPVGAGGKGLLMLSGGIDSPVAAYLAIKQGIMLELFHFESTPMTPLESVQKVIDLAKIIAKYSPKNQIKLHLVPFYEIHQAILKKVDDPYIITIMRRFMYKIAEIYANQKGIACLVNGESVGQVASQTLQSMVVVEAVTKIPILRPVVTYDKQDIIDLAKKLKTFDISTRPFNDCCSIYVPKNPITMPKLKECLFQETKLNVDELIEICLDSIQSIFIKPDTDFVIAEFGFDVKESLIEWMKK